MLLRWTGWGAVDASDTTAQALAEHFDFVFAVAVNFLLARQLHKQHTGVKIVSFKRNKDYMYPNVEPYA